VPFCVSFLLQCVRLNSGLSIGFLTVLLFCFNYSFFQLLVLTSCGRSNGYYSVFERMLNFCMSHRSGSKFTYSKMTPKTDLLIYCTEVRSQNKHGRRTSDLVGKFGQGIARSGQIADSMCHKL